MSDETPTQTADQVEELTGRYGPLYLEERQVQRIWALRAYEGEGMVTRMGKRLRVLSPGRWNFQEGPDFREAVLEMDGKRVHGDVELHLHEKDWIAHGHHSDPNFDGVVLHVVLFADPNRAETDERYPRETLDWLKYLRHDLEEYLDEQVIHQLTEDPLPEALHFLQSVPEETRLSLLAKAARQRWERKCRLAGKRLEREGWTEACHQIFLETLGLRRNRAIMARVALEYPLTRWEGADAAFADHVFYGCGDAWNLAGCRPANRPDRRLRDYAGWVSECGIQWPEAIPRPRGDSALPLSVPDNALNRVAGRRKTLQIPRQADLWRAYFQGAMGGARLDTWIINGLLPLLTAKEEWDCFALWFCWYPGDLPDEIKTLIRQLEVTGPGRPICNGWSQAILRMFEPDYRCGIGGAHPIDGLKADSGE